MAGIFDLVDSMVAQELGVDEKTYTQVIEHECTYWEAQFIIGAMFEEGNETRKEKGRKIFNQYVGKKNESS